MARTVSHVAIVGVLIWWAFLTHQRAEVWQSERSLWADAERVSPFHPRVQINLGRTYADAGEFDEGVRHFDLALQAMLDGRRNAVHRAETAAVAASNISQAWMEQGKVEQALRLLDGVIAKIPYYPLTRYNRGVIYLALGETSRGCADIAIARRSRPDLLNGPGCAR